MQVDSLNDIYAKSNEQRQRYQHIAEAFQKEYGMQPTVFVRSPGRVNLIGEHIDYSGYSVLPMALDRDVVIALAPRTSSKPGFTLANSRPEYPQRQFEHKLDTNFIDFDPTQHEWTNYFAGAYRAFFQTFGQQVSQPASFYAFMDGTVPPGGGVSSSAAFCCVAALAIAVMNQIPLDQEALVDLGIKAEHHVGVKCGGMDQSISVMGRTNSALLIHFVPKLMAIPTPIPAPELVASKKEFDPPVFVVANTLVVADKHKTAPTNYNLRVVETKLAAALLAKKLGLSLPASGLFTLRDVADAYCKNDLTLPIAQKTIQDLSTMSLLVEKWIKKEAYSWEEIALELEMEIPSLTIKFVQQLQLEIKAEHFELYKRAKHVYEEAKRVFEFQAVCAGDLGSTPDNVLQKLGQLMNESQQSCKDLFHCSCPELDELTALCRKLGAYGSRLTGAGWGGCTVSLVTQSQVASFVDALKQQYYFSQPRLAPLFSETTSHLEDVLFYCAPGRGSAYISIDSI